jgi:hypothetical protein
VRGPPLVAAGDESHQISARGAAADWVAGWVVACAATTVAADDVPVSIVAGAITDRLSVRAVIAAAANAIAARGVLDS